MRKSISIRFVPNPLKGKFKTKGHLKVSKNRKLTLSRLVPFHSLIRIRIKVPISKPPRVPPLPSNSEVAAVVVVEVEVEGVQIILKKVQQNSLFDNPNQVSCLNPEVPVAGRLSMFKDQWLQFPVDRYVQEILNQGHSIPFSMGRPPFRGIRFTPLVGSFSDVLGEEVRKLLVKGAIEVVPPSQAKEGFYSTYFLVPKKTGDLRPILNLRPLNKVIQIDTFKMETLSNVIMSVSPGQWLVSLDLKDAYFHVPVNRAHWKYLRFAFQGKCYQYKVIPFGLSTSPRVFTKVLAVVVAAIRLQGVHIHPYLDDILLRGDSPQEVLNSLHIARNLLIKAGYIINLDKSHLVPTQDMVFIGGRFRTDLGLVFLPQERLQALLQAVKAFRVGIYLKAKVWLSLLGKAVATFQVVRFARLFVRPLQLFLLSQWNSQQSLEKNILCTRPVFQALQWWADPLNLGQGQLISPPVHQHVLTTDASGSGWGGVLDDSWSIQGTWSNQQKLWHINALEMLAVELSLKKFCHHLSNSVVLVRSDNTTTCAYINKMGGTKSPQLCIQVYHLLLWCKRKSIVLRAAFVPGLLNVQADALSRWKSKPIDHSLVHQVDHREWALHPQVANSLFILLGEPTIDLFATQVNKKLQIFCSLIPSKSAVHQDAFTLTWNHHYGYIFPPIKLLPRVLAKVKRDRAKVLLVAPRWPRQFWYNELLNMLCHPPVLLPHRQDLLSQSGILHNNPESLQLTGWLLCGDPSDNKAFLRRLSTQQCSNSLPVHSGPIPINGIHSVIGVVNGVSIPVLQL